MSKVTRTLFRLLPESFRDQYRGQWNRQQAWIRWQIRNLLGSNRPPASDDGGPRIHLGCGKIDIKGYVNVDAAPHPHVHYRSSLERLPMFRDNRAAMLYASHCLEHFPYREVPGVLKEWVRVLRPGGVLRIAVPDFDVILKAYLISGNNIESVIGPLLGGQDYPLNFHYAAFTHKHLSRLLEQAGLEDIRVWTPGESRWAPMNDCATSTITVGSAVFPVSLNLEGVKRTTNS